MPEDSDLTIKQQREARRSQKVTAMRRQLALQKRKQRIAVISAITGGVLVIALIVAFVVIGATPKPKPADITVSGVKTFPSLTAVHVAGAVDYAAKYDMDPPAGGDHNAVWLNCGVYDQPQQNENAVHALEHGAVWVTYDPSLSEADVATLRAAIPKTYGLLSPYPGLPAAVVASAWGVQVQLDSASDPRLKDFITKYWQGPATPEPGAPCTGGIDGPGRVS